MHIQIIKGGAKNFSVVVKNIVTKDFVALPIIDLDKITPPQEGWRGLRLDSAVWLIEEKMGLRLWWEEEQTPVNLILPMESRNFVRFDEGIQSPRVAEGWNKKIWLSSFNFSKGEERGPINKSFMLLLDFDKQ